MPQETALRGFKVTDAKHSVRRGIAANTLKDLQQKTVDKFDLDLCPEDVFFRLPDGTIVDEEEYFKTVQSHTLLVWIKRPGEGTNQKSPPPPLSAQFRGSEADLLYASICRLHENAFRVGTKAFQCFTTSDARTKLMELIELFARGSDQTLLSTKIEHPEWFQGLDTNSKTKEDYLFKRAQDRIRTYYYKTRDELSKSSSSEFVSLVHRVFTTLQNMLRSHKFHGYYFDRQQTSISCPPAALSPDPRPPWATLCNRRGDFLCQGRWDVDQCQYGPAHTINPYSSRENRIIFTTWNLDHTIERSRSIIPAVRKALENHQVINHNSEESDIKKLDLKLIYNDLFTLNNLKFVHIVCHDKGKHISKTAGPYILL